jgi:hypothetical protein
VRQLKKRTEEFANLVIKQEEDQVLEISSTGYGLESVSKQGAGNKSISTDKPTCEGL